MAYVAESAASAPPPRPGPPLIPPPRASNVPAAGFQTAPGGFPEAAGSGGGDFDEEAEPAFASSSAASGVSAPDDGEGPPLEELEAQMRGELAGRDQAVAASRGARRAVAAAADEDDADGKAGSLPEVDALVARLPAEVRETLDELFRARFVSVKKLPKKLFQAATTKKGGSAGPSGSSSSASSTPGSA